MQIRPFLSKTRIALSAYCKHNANYKRLSYPNSTTTRFYGISLLGNRPMQCFNWGDCTSKNIFHNEFFDLNTRGVCTASAASEANIDPVLNAIKQVIGEDKVNSSEAVRNNHKSLGKYSNLCSAVVTVKSTEEIQSIVNICRENKMPIIPYGAGTSLEGHIDCPYGGIMLDISEMNEVLQINAEDWDVTVQAGVTREALNDALRYTGLFFPVDPGANATIGGMVATNASGTTTLKYGSMKQLVLGVKAVMADGSIVTAGGRARKSSAGYDLTRLFIGSEGTLGIITEITIKLTPQPEAQSAAVCSFKSLEDAVQAVLELTLTDCPARMELLDLETMKCLDGYQGKKFEIAPTLFLEFHGSDTFVKDQAESIRETMEGYGAYNFKYATEQEERNQLWEARHNSYWAIKAKYPGKEILATDGCVPVSKLAEVMEETAQDIKELGLIAPLFGHVGDGNFHAAVLFDPKNPKELELAEKLGSRIAEKSISKGGTCTGEHGIGVLKQKYLEKEFGSGAVTVMKQIKIALDPHNIMNPGKQVPL